MNKNMEGKVHKPKPEKVGRYDGKDGAVRGMREQETY